MLIVIVMVIGHCMVREDPKRRGSSNLNPVLLPLCAGESVTTCPGLSAHGWAFISGTISGISLKVYLSDIAPDFFLHCMCSFASAPPGSLQLLDVFYLSPHCALIA